ncbi:MAG: 50S ribosomal protein L29 [Firmicutes bacterium]|nr:50S ribosomal protein L29 [Bacillota bacterium]
MKGKDIRELDNKDLGLKLDDLRKELFNLRFSHTTGQLSNPMQLVNVRKDIARVLTIMQERKLHGDDFRKVAGKGRGKKK